MRVQATRPRPRFEVTADGDGIAGHAGVELLSELADRLGLTRALAWRAGRGQTPRHRYDAGAVLRDLAVMLADGGDCLSDLAALRDQPELFGPVASTPTAWWTATALPPTLRHASNAPPAPHESRGPRGPDGCGPLLLRRQRRPHDHNPPPT